MPPPLPIDADNYTIKAENAQGESVEPKAPVNHSGFAREIAQDIDSEVRCSELESLAAEFYFAADTALELSRAAIGYASQRSAEASRLSHQAHRLTRKISDYRKHGNNPNMEVDNGACAAAMADDPACPKYDASALAYLEQPGEPAQGGD